MFEHLFTCALCERPVNDYPNRNGRDRHLAPLCKGCEGEYSKGVGAPKAGSFMDRRRVVQIAALSNALLSMAHYIRWEQRYGSA
ncbi:MAG TPA: hypothetical protein VFB45_15255 [Pseudolabrys sp.]|nr:hypothetical protein [Pseudolabrys sp.]